MDANYIIGRLKSSLYKYPTADALRKRLNNLDARTRSEILSNLKFELHKEINYDIQEPLFDLVYRSPIAS